MGEEMVDDTRGYPRGRADDDYRCGTCGSGELVLTAFAHDWDVRCGNGHKLLPIAGTIIQIRHEGVTRG